jgi:3-deoxy-manno-octulosonate cytidylyltransferase (CMP-KDO synthetase)
MPSPKAIAVVPARHASVRFPGKPLAQILGKPMMQHVVERVRQVPGFSDVILATDDERIVSVANAAGLPVCVTRADHPTGTDRVWEAAEPIADAEIIFNVQGDEPGVNPAHLALALDEFNRQPDWDMITLVTPLSQDDEAHLEDWLNPNIVKAVLVETGRVVYFSRASVPFNRPAFLETGSRTAFSAGAYRHIGVYGFRREALKRFVSLPTSYLEVQEGLEQLRALTHGMTIGAVVVDKAPIGVDTPEDLARAILQMEEDSTPLNRV